MVTSPAFVSRRLCRERPVGRGGELHDRGVKPAREPRVRIAAQPADKPGGDLQVIAGDEDLVVGEVVQSARVVGMQVRQHHPTNSGGSDAEPLQPGADLLLWRDPCAQSVAVVGMPAREVVALGGAGRLAGVDHDDAFRMLDREGVDRQRVGPVPIEEHVQLPAAAASDALDLAGLDRDRSGLDRVDLHRRCSLALRGVDARRTGAGAKPRRMISATPSASCSSSGPPVMRRR